MSRRRLKKKYGSLDELVNDLHLILKTTISGYVDNISEFTLTASTTSTVVTDGRVHEGSTVVLMPTTANAAAALGTTSIVPGTGNFTVTHANNSQTDRTFGYIVQG